MVAATLDLSAIVGVVALDVADELASVRRTEEIERDWRAWHAALFPTVLYPPYAPYHVEFWDWVWSLRPDTPARPFVAVWPRGFAKSSSAEVACAAVAARGTRRYGLYICDTQDQADTHVGNVAALLESAAFARAYPACAERQVGKYGNSQGWRRNRLRTASGFTLDAIGLDSATRGAKVEEERPDLLIFDDIDDVLDSPRTIARKITSITKSLLPARAPHAVTLVVQNLIHKDGIVAQLVDGRADFLADRIVSGPHPAVRHAEFALDETGQWRIVAGEPTWAAMDIPALERDIAEIGLRAFRAEKQHEVALERDGALWSLDVIDDHRVTAVPSGVDLVRVVVGVDPPASATGAECGIVVAGLGRDKHGYVIEDVSRRGSPLEWATAAIAAFDRHEADAVVVEVNQGGEMAVHTLRSVRPTLPIVTVRASRGKAIRAEPIAALYQQGRGHHVGRHPALEDQMVSWVPGDASPDRLDALVWALTSCLEPLLRKPNRLRGWS